MTDETSAPAPTETPAAAVDVAANVATAKEMHHTLGQDIQSVGRWLYATTVTAFESVEHAIEHILKTD